MEEIIRPRHNPLYLDLFEDFCTSQSMGDIAGSTTTQTANCNNVERMLYSPILTSTVARNKNETQVSTQKSYLIAARAFLSFCYRSHNQVYQWEFVAHSARNSLGLRYQLLPSTL